MFGVSTVLAIDIQNKYGRFFLAFLGACLGILLIVYFCYIAYKENAKNRLKNNDDKIRRKNLQKEIEHLTKEKFILFTSCAMVKKKSASINVVKNLKAFEYDEWMDVTDLVDIESKIESSLRLLVKFEIEFDNVETEQSYKDHVEQFSTEVRDNCGEENGEIATALNVEIGSIRNGKMFGSCMSRTYGPPFLYRVLQEFHWIFYLIHWILKFVYDRKIQTITIKKVIMKQQLTVIQ